MSDTCQFVVAPSVKCGGPLGTGSQRFCQLHYFNDGGNITDANTVNTYISQHQADKMLRLSRVSFENLHFQDVRFPEYKTISFSGSSFVKCDFKDISFTHTVLYDDCTFDNTHFLNVHFWKHFSCRRLNKGEFKESSFKDCHFHKQADFKGFVSRTGSVERTVFDGNTLFDEAILEDTRFEGVEFRGAGTIFDAATIASNTPPFKMCEFIGEKPDEGTPIVSFKDCLLITDYSPFSGCWIEAESISFAAAVLECDRFFLLIGKHEKGLRLDHYLLVYSNKIDFTGFKCSGHFEFTSMPKFLTFAPKVDFMKVLFSQMKSANFIEANLEKALFRYSIFDSVNFMNTQWPEDDSSENRAILYEDKLMRAQMAAQSSNLRPTTTEFRLFWNQIMQQYVQLKKNYEDDRDYVGASDWAYREMEWRCTLTTDSRNDRTTRWSRFWARCFFGLYRSLSDYGESYVKPFLILFSFLLIFTTINFYNGFSWDGTPIEYDCDVVAWSWDNVSDFLRAAGATLSSTVPFLGKSVKDTGIMSSGIAIAQSFVTAVLLPLFLLALRRKFRR